MDKLQIERVRDRLQTFDFNRLFIEELGWSHARGAKPVILTIANQSWQARPIAELSGVVVFLLVGLPDPSTRLAIHKALSEHAHENLILFVDHAVAPTQSLWLWVKREGSKRFPREHLYVKGQPGDLFISKISGIVVDINELDEQGRFPLAQLVERMRSALDVERVTKKFFKEYDAQRLALVDLIQGIPDERDRRWYASVLMNRLMFVWFLQRKHFLDDGNANYLTDKLAESRHRGQDRFYTEFLQALFFEGFAKTPDQRSTATRALIGDIRYLNGGLFLPHRLEREYGSAIRIPDTAFANLFSLFAGYSWNLDDTPGGRDNEINPDVLGYIFEKYINKKAFGAYYTRPEISEYLCERTIHRLILARVNTENPFDLPLTSGRKFHSLADLLLNLDSSLCRELLFQVLPHLKLLDPACGSGAFLVAAMRTLINIYSAVIGRIKFLNDKSLAEQVKTWETEHKSLSYFIKRTIITDNLFGVDIMEEATEIAKLRLFLALVSSAQTLEQLEPLPNIDFNILAGNSLIGLIKVDAEQFDASKGEFGGQVDLFRKSYRQVLDEKNRLIDTYRHTVTWAGDLDLSSLKRQIETQKGEAQTTLNEILLNEWHQAGIKFEEATWDTAQGKQGKPKKRNLRIADIETLQPFHWGFEFDEILNRRGGFDAIITNPPWEIFKPNAKEFFQEHSNLVSKKKMTIKEFEKEQTKLLKDSEIRSLWLDYLSRFPHVSNWFRAAPQFKHQSAIVNGKKTGSDINLYKLFVEQCVNLLREGGDCGIVIPSGIYTDLGAKGLRDILFDKCKITVLFGLSNEKHIFEEVHHAQKFCLMAFEKGGQTTAFEAAFRINPREAVAPQALGGFLNSPNLHINYSADLVNRASPDSRSVMEFKSEIDIRIVEKMLQFPLLGETIDGTWNLRLTNEFHMTNDSHLFKTEPGTGRLPMIEGKMAHQFEIGFSDFRYWIDEQEGRQELLGKKGDQGKLLDYQRYRCAFRRIARNTDQRTFIATIIPPAVFAAESFNYVISGGMKISEQVFLAALLNSFAVDFYIRQMVTANLNMFFAYQAPISRLTTKDPAFSPIATRAARLICTTPEFDDLAKEISLKHLTPNPSPTGRGGQYGATDPADRARLRAELDGLIAHLYGLTEAEFAHILSTFPLVAEPVKIAALNAWRDVERGLIQ